MTTYRTTSSSARKAKSTSGLRNIARAKDMQHPAWQSEEE